MTSQIPFLKPALLSMLGATLLLSHTWCGAELNITYPENNSVVPGDNIVIEGTGANPNGTIEIKVHTDRWYTQNGEADINADGSWTFAPCYVKGTGRFNNHAIKATVVKDGERIEHAIVVDIVRSE